MPLGWWPLLVACVCLAVVRKFDIGLLGRASSKVSRKPEVQRAATAVATNSPAHRHHSTTLWLFEATTNLVCRFPEHCCTVPSTIWSALRILIVPHCSCHFWRHA